MGVATELLREQGREALWQRCLGFLDWTVEQTVDEQKRLLERRLATSSGSALFVQLTGAKAIRSIDEFREIVPLTTYETYADSFGLRRVDAIAERPARWLLTSGRASGGSKWLPLSHEAQRELGWSILGVFIAALARGRGDVRLPTDLRLLNLTAPSPYLSGTAVSSFVDLDLWDAELFPPDDPVIDDLPIEERVAMAFSGAARRGVDIAVSYSSVLAGIGGSLARRHRAFDGRTARQWGARGLARLAGARMAAAFARRPLLPRDLWRPKAIVAGGMDAGLFRRQIIEQWGCDPLELFVSTEGLFLGMQTWDRTTTTLTPHFNFFEFLPGSEALTSDEDGGHARTLLFDEIGVGEVYELVVTSLLGGALMRFRTGELVALEATSNPKSGVRLPQFSYRGQRSDLIEIGGFSRLSERVIAAAMVSAEMPTVGWTARKEVENGLPIVRIWFEDAADPDVELAVLGARLNGALRRIDPDWQDMEDLADIHPLRLTRLPRGTFAALAIAESERVPSAVNASDESIASLLAVAASRSAVPEVSR